MKACSKTLYLKCRSKTRPTKAEKNRQRVLLFFECIHVICENVYAFPIVASTYGAFICISLIKVPVFSSTQMTPYREINIKVNE